MSETLIESLKKAGFSGRHAIIVSYLLKQTQPVSVWTIELNAHQRQNVIAPLLKNLVNRGWVEESQEPEKKVGRPGKLYRFTNRTALLTYIESSVTDEARAIILGADA